MNKFIIEAEHITAGDKIVNIHGDEATVETVFMSGRKVVFVFAAHPSETHHFNDEITVFTK